MNKYEIMAIISNAMTAKEAEAQVKTSITDRIGELGGKVTFEDFWGERGFAYKINGEKWGYYSVLRFEMAPEQNATFRRELNIDTKVVRFLMTSVTKHMSEPTTYADMQKKAVELAKKDEEKSAEKKSVPAASKAAPKKEEAPKKKDDVEKKIDAIFDAELS